MIAGAEGVQRRRTGDHDWGPPSWQDSRAVVTRELPERVGLPEEGQPSGTGEEDEVTVYAPGRCRPRFFADFELYEAADGERSGRVVYHKV